MIHYLWKVHFKTSEGVIDSAYKYHFNHFDQTIIPMFVKNVKEFFLIPKVSQATVVTMDSTEKCNICDKSFKNKNVLKAHMKRHQQCESLSGECGDSFHIS